MCLHLQPKAEDTIFHAILNCLPAKSRKDEKRRCYITIWEGRNLLQKLVSQNFQSSFKERWLQHFSASSSTDDIFIERTFVEKLFYRLKLS